MEMILRGFEFFFLLGCVAPLSLIDSKLARVIGLLESRKTSRALLHRLSSSGRFSQLPSVTGFIRAASGHLRRLLRVISRRNNQMKGKNPNP